MSTAAMKDIEMLAAAGAISPSLGPRAYDSPDSGTKPVAMMATQPTLHLHISYQELLALCTLTALKLWTTL